LSAPLPEKTDLNGSFFCHLLCTTDLRQCDTLSANSVCNLHFMQMTLRKTSKLVCLLLRSSYSLQVLLSAPNETQLNPKGLTGTFYLFFFRKSLLDNGE